MMAYDVVVGIDPGFTGAVATYFRNQRVFVYDMPVVKLRSKTRIDVDKLVELLTEQVSFADAVVIEKVGSMPRQGVASAFNFGYGAGLLRGICATLEKPVIEVVPAKWKAEVGLKLPTGATHAERKTASRELAQVLFPEDHGLFTRVKDDGRAEAALLAWWGAK